MTSSTDPRERVIQLGNELRRTEQSHRLGDDDIKTVLLPLLEAEQRMKAAHDAYITARSIVEALRRRRGEAMTGVRPSLPDPVHWMREQGMSDKAIAVERESLDRASAWLDHLAPFALRERSAYLRGDFDEVAHQAWHVEQHVRELGVESAKAHAIIVLLLAMLADSTIMIGEILAVTDDTDSAGPDTPTGPADTTEAAS